MPSDGNLDRYLGHMIILFYQELSITIKPKKLHIMEMFMKYMTMYLQVEDQWLSQTWRSDYSELNNARSKNII